MKIAEALFNLGVDSLPKNRKKSRVGLLHHVTGVPAFLIFIKGTEKSFSVPFASMEAIDHHLSQTQDKQDRMAWLFVREFFELGGVHAHVCVSPLTGSTSQERLASMIGAEKGLTQRAGIFTLKNAVDRADLIIIPQGPLLLSSKDYQTFCQTLLDWTATQPNFFSILDLPKGIELEKAIEWIFPIHSEDGAFYYPWIIKNQEIRPSTPAVAAAYQLSDYKYGVGENPANRPMSPQIVPLMQLTSQQVSILNKSRINALIQWGEHPPVLWGSRVAAAVNSSEFKWISTRRTLKALREAITSICESFVMEPLKGEVEKIITNELEDFCLANKFLFNLEKQKPFRIQTQVLSDRQSSGLQVDCEFQFNTCIETVHLSVGLRN